MQTRKSRAEPDVTGKAGDEVLVGAHLQVEGKGKTVWENWLGKLSGKLGEVPQPGGASMRIDEAGLPGHCD